MLGQTRLMAAGVLAAWGSWLFTSSATIAEELASQRPNILLIVVDDMGFSDPGCYGGEIDTPHIDQLAATGIRFTQFYNCSRCCQTRASLLTGAYPHRVGMREFGRTMDKSVPTIAENLRDSGYATAMVGKWHLSELPHTESEAKRILWMNHELFLDRPFAETASYPTHRGFERFYGIIWGVVNHFDPFSLTDGEEAIRDVPRDFYMTDAISDRTVEYLGDFAVSNKPFFLYVAYTAPHWPIQAPPQDIAKYERRYDEGWDELRRERFRRQLQLGLFGEDIPLGEISGRSKPWSHLSPADKQYQARKMAVHAAMVDHVDQGIGQILAAMRENGQLENTIIFFLSDNGASPEIPGGPGYDRPSGTRDGRPSLREAELRKHDNWTKLGSDESYAGIGPSWASAVNTPLRYWKAESYEGGCRTPLIVHWPQGITVPDGSFVSDIGHVIDIAPTCYELADATPRPETFQDGVSLTPILAGEQLTNDRVLYFEHGVGSGIRKQQWKASKRGDRDWELFDLERDPGETHDLTTSHHEIHDALIEAWRTWMEGVANGAWTQ